MGLIRFLLVVMMALSASVVGAMDVRHAATLEHGHAALESVADDQPVCCTDSSERTQGCHVLPALLPATGLHDSAPASCEDISFGTGLLLTGIEPSGPLDPPRAV